MTLYELTGQWQQVQDALYDPDFDQESAEAMLDDIEAALEDKADHYAMMIKSMEADAAALDEEIRRLCARRSTLGNRAGWLKERLQMAMYATGKTKFKTPYFTFGIQKNPSSVVLDADLSDIPDNYLIPQPPKVDKKAIGAAIKAGEDISFAHLEQSEGLRIR